jgi:membrane protein DedA with SNARE-associated domain
MSISSLIQQHGYWAVFVGSFLEGETVLLFAGFAAHRGLLRLPVVMLLAFLASTLADQSFFFAGRRYGARLMARFPSLAARVPRVERLLGKHHTGLILSVRFLYGLRLAGPVALGMLGVSPLRFALLNMLGAAVWAVSISELGYQFGNLLQLVVQDLKHVEETVLLAILLAGACWWAVRLIRQRKADTGSSS